MQQLTIVKIGGNIIDNESALKDFLNKFHSVIGHRILIHGGGKLATNLQQQLGIPVNMLDGRRITDAETLKIVTMVYAGLINKNITTALQALGCNALGLCGADANTVLAKKRESSIDYGFAGDIVSVNSDFIKTLLANNMVPVFSAITHNGQGQLLNTNADTLASELAIAMTSAYKVGLVYCFEKSGVLENAEDETTVVKKINRNEYLDLKLQNKINKGMLPKMEAAFNAIDKGVNIVQIGKAENLLQLIDIENYEGTRLCNT